MTIDFSVQPFLELFFDSFPFQNLPIEARKQLIPKLSISTFNVGEELQTEGELPIALHCLIEGEVRVLGASNHQCPTLSKCGTGAVIGWEALLRRRPYGSVRAAQPVRTVSISADEFERWLPKLLDAFSERISILEIADVLTHLIHNLPHVEAKANFVSTLRQLELMLHAPPEAAPKLVAQYWTGSNSIADGYDWFVSSAADATLAIATKIEPQTSIPKPLGTVRLVGIAPSVLSTILPASSVELIRVGSTSAIDSPIVRQSQHSKTYPAYRAQTRDVFESVNVAFWNVCTYLDIPYRPQSLRAWYPSFAALSVTPISLCPRIAPIFGLHTRSIKTSATAAGLARVQCPALIVVDDELCVLYHATSRRVTIATPHNGRIDLDARALRNRLAVSGTASGVPCVEVVQISRLNENSSQPFGWRWLASSLVSQRSILIQVVLASIFIQLLGLANPLLIQQIIDRVIIAGNGNAMPVFAALILAFAVLESILTVLRTYLLNSTTNRIDLLLGTQIVRHLMNLPLAFFGQRAVGDVSARIFELEKVRQFLTGTFFTVAIDVLFSIVYIGVMSIYSVWLTLCVLVAVPVIIGSTLLVAPMFEKLIRKRADQSAQMQAYLIERLNGIFTIKAQNQEATVQATWRDQYMRFLGTGFRTAMLSAGYQSATTLTSNISSLLVLIVGGQLVLSGQLTLGGLIAFRILAGYVTAPLVRLSRLWQNFQEADQSMQHLRDITDAPAEFSPEDAQKMSLPPIKGRVQYENVNFGFQPNQLQLQDINLTIAPGCFVGVVGQSGSGKSTLVKLLLRLQTVNSGQIYIDGIDISKTSLRSLRSQVGIVPQEPILFNGTVRDNIAGDQEVDDAQIIEAARIACAHDFIMTLADGYNTPTGERGASLSGGQRQRIAIARMVLASPRLVILDEATSALDYDTERRVVENLMRRFSETTVLFITHRLANLRRADWIVYLQSGVLVEQGTHAQLMAAQQRYYCLYRQQSKE